MSAPINAISENPLGDLLDHLAGERSKQEFVDAMTEIEGPIAANQSKHQRYNMRILVALWIGCAVIAWAFQSPSVAVIAGVIAVTYSVHRYVHSAIYQLSVLTAAAVYEMRRLAAKQDKSAATDHQQLLRILRSRPDANPAAE